MKNIVANDFLILQPGQLISVSADAALTMQIDCGRVWVTIEGVNADYWLFDGDTLALIAGRHVVIEAVKVFSRIDFLPSLQFADRLCMPMPVASSDIEALAGY
ncbi:MAG: DUF2917 domain-containing protein [Glaciimonas sp.]|nr:DUF2917 domain-containing protein [Glaciimonas sp.]